MVSRWGSWPQRSCNCHWTSEDSLQSRLQSCKEKRAWQNALSLLGWAFYTRENLHETNFNAAGSACSQKNWMFALHLMAKRPDTASRNIAIAASTKAGSWRLGLLVVSTMQDSTVRANLISYNSAAGSVEWAMAMWLTGRMGQPGKDRQWATGSISTATFNIDKRDVVGLNAVLTAAGNNWSQAMLLLARAPCARLQVNIRCFTGALSVCERTTFWQRAINVLGLTYQVNLHDNGVARSDIAPDKKSMSTLISACGKGFQWELASTLLMRDLPGRSILPDAIVFSTAINACKDGTERWGVALGMFTCLMAMKQFFRTPEDMASAYQVTMSSCRPRWQLSLFFLQMMGTARVFKSGKLGDEACWNAAVSACDAGNMWQKAVQLSLFGHCQRNLIGMNSAISACSAPASQWEVAVELQVLQVQDSIPIDTWQEISVWFFRLFLPVSCSFSIALMHSPHPWPQVKSSGWSDLQFSSFSLCRCGAVELWHHFTWQDEEPEGATQWSKSKSCFECW